MFKRSLILLACVVITGVGRAESRLGIGAEYLHTIKNTDVHNFDRDSVAWIGSYQCRAAALLGFEADLEFYRTGLGGSQKEVWSPQAFLVVGKGLYAAAGIGGVCFDGEWGDNPVYIFRAGLDLELISGIHIDINANYRFQDWGNLNNSSTDIGTDTVSLGAALRFAL